MSSELEIERYDLVRFDLSRRGGVVACFVKNYISYNRKPNFCINTESIFIEIFLTKSKPVLIGILYRPPDKYDFVNCLERTFSDTNVFESQECYLLGDININLQPKDKEIFRHKPANTINKEIPHLTRSYLEFCFTHSLEQIITRSTRITDQTATLIDRILTNSPDKVSQSGVIDLGISTHDLIYCTRKASLPKSHKHNEVFVRSLKRYSAEKFLEILREIVVPNYLTYTCVNDACFKSPKKINAKLKFLYHQSRYLPPAYRRLLCNALIEPHFDYECSSWFPLLKKIYNLNFKKLKTNVFAFA